MADEKLKPCPFCGGEAYFYACDVLIQIGCKHCNYHMAFDGLLCAKERHPNCPAASSDGKLVYNRNAHEDAISVWNTRQCKI